MLSAESYITMDREICKSPYVPDIERRLERLWRVLRIYEIGIVKRLVNLAEK